MSWEERDYAADDDPWRKFGRPGGDWQGLRPTFDNPMTWALPIGRFAGITVRFHFVFLLLIAIWLVQTVLEATPATLVPNLMLIGALILMVLLHEFGHCIACRWVGGQANEILMWPLGGLAYTQPSNTWQANLVTTIGGPLVNVIFLAVIVPTLWLVTGELWGVAVPSPFDISAIGRPPVGNSVLNQALFALTYVNLVLVLFNAVPMFPLDGGRILQELLWSRLGYSRSMRIAVRVGYFGAIAMGLVGFILPSYTLVGVAFFGGITCYITYKQVQWTDDMMGFGSDDYALTLHHGQPGFGAGASQPSARAQRKAERKAEQEQAEAAEVDRVLQKIAKHGLDSLSRTERKVLQRATDRKRQEES